MVEVGQDLPLAAQPPHDVGAVHAAADDLDRHPALELVVVALGLVDRGHAAAADFAQDAVGPEVGGRHLHLAGSGVAVVGPGLEAVADRQGEAFGQGGRQLAAAGAEHGFELGPQPGIGRGREGGVEKGVAAGRRQGLGFREEALEALPALLFHSPPRPAGPERPGRAL